MRLINAALFLSMFFLVSYASSGTVHAYLDPSYTTYGKPGALLQRVTGDILVDGIWQYQKFIHGEGMQDKKLHFNVNASLRGGDHLFLQSREEPPGVALFDIVEIFGAQSQRVKRVLALPHRSPREIAAEEDVLGPRELEHRGEGGRIVHAGRVEIPA